MVSDNRSKEQKQLLLMVYIAVLLLYHSKLMFGGYAFLLLAGNVISCRVTTTPCLGLLYIVTNHCLMKL